MCFALDMPCGASGIYLISKRSYIEWAQPIYRICVSKYIDKSRAAHNAVRLFFSKIGNKLGIRRLVLLDEALQTV
jgi:hypothetical protein